MVRLEVANGKISIRLKQDSVFPIYEEVGNGVAELLAELQAELVRMGNSQKLPKEAAAFRRAEELGFL